LDSIFFAQKIAKLIESNPDISHWKALDLCAGCGIIGFDLSHHTQHQMKIDFVEVQEVYRSYFDKNKQMIAPNANGTQFSFLNINYRKLLDKEFENSYDLIVCNPPYFFKDEGLLSPNDFKNRCRFFIDSDFETLIKAIIFTLNPGSSAYVLIRAATHHGRAPLHDIITILGADGSAEIIDHVRGTDIIRINKHTF
jgi:tRNA1Val (adenine37-N6)-methyltransferase